jgi:XTP/dITP diphosphohydrolase
MKHSKAPGPPRTLVIATANAGKLREFQAMLAGLPFMAVSQSSLGVPSPEETGDTFAANALIKARHAAAVTGAPAIADDSGLEVDALGGAPGIYSARYAGPEADDAANNAKLIAALAGLPLEARRARYRCALVYVDGPDDAVPLEAHGTWEGCIIDEPRGSGGFGYDPYFWLPERGATAAELPAEEKNRLSHRGTALIKLRSLIETRLASARRA